MKILSWNILADEFIKKRYYPMIPPDILLNRKHRQTQIIHSLIHMDMDVMLLQEVMQSEYNALAQTFQRTHHLLRGPHIKWQGKQSHSGNVILLRKSLFSKLTLIPLNFGLGVQCLYRNHLLLILNIHLDDISHEDRVKQLEELLPAISQSKKVIMGGDFNENYTTTSELYQRLKKNTGLKIVNHKPTYYIERKMCIDNILTKGLNLKHPHAHVLDAFNGDRVKQFITYGSDHLPVAIN
jgi:endonuclease/exonuclease/phosphatase family metal-dependent hydrolase